MFPDETYHIAARKFHVKHRTHDDILDAHPDVRSYIDHVASTIVIRLEDGMSQDARDELLFHELLHAVVKNAGLDQCLRDGFSEEFLVSALAPRIHDLFKKNFMIDA